MGHLHSDDYGLAWRNLTVDLAPPGWAPRPGAALELDSFFNCFDTEENGIVGAADTINVTSDSSIAVLLCNLLTPRLTWLPPIEQFILAVKLTLSLHHWLYHFTAAAASPLRPALRHAHVESVPSRVHAAGSKGLNPQFLRGVLTSHTSQ